MTTTTDAEEDPQAIASRIHDEVSTVLVGKDHLLDYLTISLLTRGHVLFEGVPGNAKTTIAELFARATGLSHNRIQMTPDVLPADITGSNVYRESTGEFELQKGPLFANIVVADEINRTTPKTQSALLEAMQERNATIDGETLSLPEPFMVIATQNPLEMEGVFELPEAQRDRFQFKLDVDYPTRDEEATILDRFDGQPELGPEDISRVITKDEILAAQHAVTDVYVADAVKQYILDLIGASRNSEDTEIGGSPRASLALLHTSKARAAIRGRSYVIPDDVKQLVAPVLNHRLVLQTDADLSGVTTDDVVDDIVDAVAPPSTNVVDDIPQEFAPKSADSDD